MTVDCSKGILYETVAFQHLVRLVRDVARTLNESVESLDVDFTYISLPKPNYIDVWQICCSETFSYHRY